MSLNKIAHVSINTVEGESRIQIHYGEFKHIHVYLSIRSNVRQVGHFLHCILQDFISIVQGYQVTEFEASSLISHETIRLFLSICRQKNNMLSLNTVYDTVAPIVTPQQNVNNAASTLLYEAYGNRPVAPTTNQSNRNDILQVLDEIKQIADEIQIPLNLDDHKSPRVSNVQTMPSSINPFTHFQEMFQAFVNADRAEQTVEERDDGETEPPERFMVNEQKVREVLVQENNVNDMDEMDVSNDEIMSVSMAPSHPTLLSKVGGAKHSDETIDKVVHDIHLCIIKGSMRSPNFNNTSRVGYRKIKNFVHNLTKIWLNQSEIDRVVIRLNILLNDS